MTTSLLPTLGVPGATPLGTDRTAAIAGLSLAEAGSVTGETFTVTLSDTVGLLTATGTGVSGSGTRTLTITGSLAQVNADLATLKDTDTGVGADTITVKATDSLGNKAATQTVAVMAAGLPVISVPQAKLAGAGKAVAVAGIGLAETDNTAGETFTVTLSDTAGLLSATGTGVSGSGTRNLTITGSLTQINADLATLKDTDSTAGTDTITVNAHDSFGNSAIAKTVAVSVSGVPVVAVPTGAKVLGVGQATAIAGVSVGVVNPAAGETFTVTILDNRGLLSATGSNVAGAGTTKLTVAGSLAQVNAALATLSDTDSIINSELGLDQRRRQLRECLSDQERVAVGCGIADPLGARREDDRHRRSCAVRRRQHRRSRHRGG